MGLAIDRLSLQKVKLDQFICYAFLYYSIFPAGNFLSGSIMHFAEVFISIATSSNEMNCIRMDIE